MAWYDPKTWFKKETEVTVIDTSSRSSSSRSSNNKRLQPTRDLSYDSDKTSPTTESDKRDTGIRVVTPSEAESLRHTSTPYWTPISTDPRDMVSEAVATRNVTRTTSPRSTKRTTSPRPTKDLSYDSDKTYPTTELDKRDTGTKITSPTNQIKDISPPTQDKNLIHKIYTGVANTFAPAKDYISSKFDKGSSAVEDIKENVEGFNERYKYETTGGKIKKAYEEIDTNVYGGYLPGGDSPSDVRTKRKAKEGYKDYFETRKELEDKNIYDIHSEVTDYDVKRDYFTWKGTAYDSKALKEVFEEKADEEIQKIMIEKITPPIKDEINKNVENAQMRLNLEAENINNIYYNGKITLEERNRRVENLEQKTNDALKKENEKIAEDIANRWWSNNEENLIKSFSLAGRDILNKTNLKKFNIKTVTSHVAVGVVTGGAVTGAVGLGLISAGAVKATTIPLMGLGLGITGAGAGKELYDKKQTYGEITALDVASSLLPTTLKIGAGVGGAIAGSVLVGGITTNLNAKNEAKFLKDHKTEINTIKNKLVRDENFLNKHLKVDGKNTYAEVNVAGKPVKFNVNVKSPSWQRTKLLREGDPSTIIKTTSVGGSQKEQILVSFKDSIGKGIRHQDISVGKIDSNVISRITGQNIKGEDWYSITSKINVAGKTQPVSYIFKWTPSRGITNVQVASLDMVSSSQGYLFTSRLNPTRLITGTSNVKGSPPLKIESLSIDRNLNVFRVDVKSTSSKEGAVTLTKTDNLLWDIKNPIIDTRSSITGVKWSGSKNEMPLTEFLSSNRGLIYDKSSLSPFRTGSSLRITADAGSRVYTADISGAKVGSKVTDSIFFEKSISQSITPSPIIKITTATSSRTPPSIMGGSSGPGSSSSFAGGSSGPGSTSLIKADSTSLITPNFQESILGMTVSSPKIISPKITTSITPPKIVDSSFRFSQFAIPQTDIKQDSSLISSSSITPRVESKRIVAPNLELNNLLGERNIQKPQYSQVNKSIISLDTTTPPLIETPVISPTTPPISKPKIDFNYGGLPLGWGLGEIKTGGGKRASPSKSLFGGKTTYTPSLGSVLLKTPSKKVTKEEAVKLSEKRYSGIGLRPIIEIEEDKKKKKKRSNSLF